MKARIRYSNLSLMAFSAVCLLWAGMSSCRRYDYSAQLLPRQQEVLNRGLVAMAVSENEAYLSWRLLGTDDAGLKFDVWRDNGSGPVRLNAKPLAKGTNFSDLTYSADADATYWVVPAGTQPDGKAGFAPGCSYTLKAGRVGLNYISIPLQTLERYTPGDCSAGDLDGDGQYEIVVKQEQMPRDNSHSGPTGETLLEAYRLDGTLMWRINLGRNIREGAHYTQFMVFDFDGDGKAEVACKTADGTVDGLGRVIGDAEADWRQPSVDGRGGGHILSGPEYLTVFSGPTGEALQTVGYVPSRRPDGGIEFDAGQLRATWGDSNGNREERYLACVAYLDGRHPSLVMCRGYYTRATLAAWDFLDGELKLRWLFDSDDPEHPENRAFHGQGNHNISVADVDGDGFDEIVYGNAVIDHDGTGLYSTRIGHADAMHVGDLDPSRPGLEVFNSQEPVGAYGMNFRNAGTGEIYWNVPTDSAAVAKERKRQGPGRDVAFDIDPRHKGSECWVFGGGISGLYDCKGNKISDKTPSSCNFAVWWDADPQRELLDRNRISKYNWETDEVELLFEAVGCTSNNGTKATPALSADLFGDWREEVVLRTRDNRELRVFFTPIPCDTRRVTLMHDPIYRLGIAWQNVAYNIPPHVSYYME